MDSALLDSYFAGALPPDQATAVEDRLLFDPLALFEAADHLRAAAPEHSRVWQRILAAAGLAAEPSAPVVGEAAAEQAFLGLGLVQRAVQALRDGLDPAPWRALFGAGTPLSASRIALPAAAAAFADEAPEPYERRLVDQDGLRVNLVEEAGGRLALYVRSSERDDAGLPCTLVLSEGQRGEPLAVSVELRDLGEAGAGARADLGGLTDLMARLGPEPECVVLIGDAPAG